jgi:phosphate transport system ATP-binding protein
MPEVALALFERAAVVVARSDSPVTSMSMVDEVDSASVTVSDQRIVARSATHEWTWRLTDVREAVHGDNGAWTLLLTGDTTVSGVWVRPERATEFRSLVDGLVRAARDAKAPASNGAAHAATAVMPTTPSTPSPPAARTPTDNGQADLDAREISAWFGSHQVLDRVSLHMPAGQVTALIGPSGCGKSTFLRILNRMHEMIPSARMAGEVLVDGHDVYDRSRRLVDARREIGMVFQKPNPFPAMSIYDNVLASYRLTGRKASTAEKDAVVEQCLRRGGLWNEVKDRLLQPGGGLSGGQQQRLCIARALAIQPRVLLMDEPCSALDPTSTRRIEETILQLVADVTIVIVTHNMQQAARVSDQCAFFLAEQGTPGVIVEHGSTDAMFNRPRDPRTNDYVNGRFG